MYLERLTPPAETPVTLAEAKAQLRVLSSDEDTLIGSLIQVATALLDGRNGMLGRALVSQAWRMKIDRFPRTIELPLPPLISVQAITYLDTAGDSQTLDPSLYIVDTGTYVGRVRPAYQAVWPIPQSIELAVTVDFTCGYGAASAVPMTIKQAMLLLINHWFFNRGSIGAMPEGAQLAVEALLSGEKLMSF
jgi:uncharacterized phiE125 gp8 family phage protein